MRIRELYPGLRVVKTLGVGKGREGMVYAVDAPAGVVIVNYDDGIIDYEASPYEFEPAKNKQEIA